MTTDKKASAAETLRKNGIAVETPQIEVVDDNDFDIQKVAESDLASLASNESFLNETVKIRIATTTDPNAAPAADITVNSPANRVIIPRGVVCTVKRLHVEVLARMKETRYTQPARNMMDPEGGNALIGRTAMVYPFEVVEDKNPAGRAWLENILAEPA